MAGSRQSIRELVGLELLICSYIVACCISLVCVSIQFPAYHILYQAAGLLGAVVVIATFALISPLFVFSKFSFGYFVGFYFYSMLIGYLWLNHFSEFGYNHLLAGLSASASAIAFLLPALFIGSPIRQIWIPSPSTFDRLLNAVLLLGIGIVAIGATYNFRPIALDNDAYIFRETLRFPTVLSYLIGITSSALLPFAFGCFLERKYLWRAGAALILLLLFFPITLSKLTLLSSAWIVAFALLSRLFEARIAVVVSLFAPLVVGIILYALFKSGVVLEGAAIPYFSLVNFRMIAIPSMAMDYYNDFFARNDPTHFCQIQLLKLSIACPYREPLAILIYKAFGIGGNFNASLFATEGIASVGTKFAPVTAFVCSLAIALGNRMSSGLPPRLILTSGAILAYVLLNVPLTVTMITHGAAVLFLLWYVTPRTMFEQEASHPSALAH